MGINYGKSDFNLNEINGDTNADDALYLNKYFKEQSYTKLLDDALGLVPEEVDNREGSLIYDALAPFDYQLSKFYEDLDNLLIQTFAVSSSFPYLDLRAFERNIFRIQATYCKKVFEFIDEDGKPATNIDIKSSTKSGTKLSTVDLDPNFTFEITDTYKTTESTKAVGEFYDSVGETESLLFKATATDKYTGSIGNDIQIELLKDESTKKFVFAVYWNGDRQLEEEYDEAAKFTDLKSNDFITISDQSTLALQVIIRKANQFTGGTDPGSDIPGQYIGTAEQTGADVNNYIGEFVIMQNTYKATVESLKNYEEAIDEETDEELRKRYFDLLTGEAFGGNIAHYRRWLLDSEFNCPVAIGAVQVYPVWNGGGTVKVSVISTKEYMPLTTAEIESVKQFLDPYDPTTKTFSGQGYGLAPIGHVVTVTTPNIVKVKFQMNLKFSTGTETTYAALVKQKYSNYFLSVRKTWGTIDTTNNSYQIIITHARLIALVLEIQGVRDVPEDYLRYSIDDGQTWSVGNLILNSTANEQLVPVVDTVEVKEVSNV